MTVDDLRAVAEATREAIRVAVTQATAPLLDRIAALEVRGLVAGPAGPPGPPGERGADGRDGMAARDGAPGPMGPAGAPGPAGERGADGRDAVPAKDGAPGPMGPAGAPGPPGACGLDGEPGAPGCDGFSLEDFTARFDGERTLTLTFARGDLAKSTTLTFPVTIYRGVYEDGCQYQIGDSVTWAGSCWIARAATTAKPGQTSEDARAWQLAIKAGRAGKDGDRGPAGEPGPKGDRGEPGRHG